MTSGRMLTPKQVAAACGLGPRAVYGAIERGELPAYRLCGRLRIDPADFEAWKEASKVAAEVAVKPPRPSTRPAADGLKTLLETTREA